MGWDWFALQLDDGRELMLYQLRTEDGHADPASAGSLIGKDGAVLRLAREDVDLKVLDTWRSPRSGAHYPARWRLRIPSQGLDLDIRPLLADQELDVSFRYWEGAVDVTARGAPDAGPRLRRAHRLRRASRNRAVTPASSSAYYCLSRAEPDTDRIPRTACPDLKDREREGDPRCPESNTSRRSC